MTRAYFRFTEGETYTHKGAYELRGGQVVPA